MDGVLLTAATVLLTVAVLGALRLLATRVRRRGIGDRVAGPFDEIRHPSGRHTHAEVQEARERLVPRPGAREPGERP